MNGGRVLFWDTKKTYGKFEYGVSIRKPYYVKEEVFIYDDKTGHIRNAANKNYVLAVQQGHNSRGAKLVMRKAQHDPSQKWRYSPGKYRNWSPFSNSGLCMDVAGGRDADNQFVHLWSCHHGQNQRFDVTYNVVRPEIRSPIKIGKTFMIRSKMGGARVLALDPRRLYSTYEGMMYGVVIRKPQYNRFERFVFLKESGLIALAHNTNWYLTVHKDSRRGV